MPCAMVKEEEERERSNQPTMSKKGAALEKS